MNPYCFNPHQQQHPQQHTTTTSMMGTQASFASAAVGGGGEGASSSTAADDKKKNANTTKGCRLVTIKQIKNASVLGESTYKIDNEDVAYVTFIAVVRSITKQDSSISYMMEDGTGAIDVKRWKIVEEQYGEITDLIVPDMYVRVIGRLHQFNGQVNNVAAHHIAIIQNFNELTCHLLETIYTHLTIGGGKLDVIATMNRLQAAEGGNYTLAEKQIIVKRAIQENYMNEAGAFIPQVKDCLKDIFTFQEIDMILEDLLGVQGQAYQTIDDNHIKLVEDF